ncbi:MAG: glycosyltransferase family 2 protein [Xenococcaceae cyanobacterium]
MKNLKLTNIAVLITCFNRQEKTLACLSALCGQTLSEQVKIQVYLVDDGSTDGTSEAVSQTYPQVKILQGDGSLYWNGGMRLAFAEAMKQDYDYYLWLNDDTILYPQALDLLLQESKQLIDRGELKAMLVGSTCEPDSHKISYGGLVRCGWWTPLKDRIVEPGKEVQPCDTMNGNCVLIPRAVVKLVGNLDPAFVHNLGDYDYGKRAKRAGCSIWVVPGYVGTCQAHLPSWREDSLTLGERLKQINTPKGLLPSEWKVYAKRHAGLFWPIYWLAPYVKLLFGKVQFD